MEAEITSVKENPLLGRRDVQVNLEHEAEATPSKEDVQSRIAAEHGLDKEEIKVENVYTGYGRNQSTAYLKITQEFEYDEELEEETIEEDEETAAVTAEYNDIVSGTITDAKNQLKEMDSPDFKAALEAEKDNKNRTTLVDWLESRIE